MKTIIAFFGILMYAFAQGSTEKQKCYHNAKSDFDLNKYLKISHAYTSYASYGSRTTVCREFNTTQNSDGLVVITVFGYYQYSGKTYYSESQCNATNPNGSNGQFSLDCIKVKDTQRKRTTTPPTNKLYISVIETDYENYAILYTCIKFGSGINENTLVLKKNKDVKDVDKIKQYLSGQGMEFDKFISRNNTYCEEVKNKNENKNI